LQAVARVASAKLAQSGPVRHGRARTGSEGFGAARPGKVRIRSGRAWPGVARRGLAR
jgi:hypothetical protein